MKNLFVLCLLACAGPVVGQALPLPVDSLSGKVTYQGIVQAPGVGAGELFRRAKSVAAGSVVPALVEESSRTVSGIWERPVGTRILRYELALFIKDGRYRYELSDFENKTMPVQVRNPATGLITTVGGGTAPLERVLAHPDGYRNGRPTAALRTYVGAVSQTAEQAVADLLRRMAAGASRPDF